MRIELFRTTSNHLYTQGNLLVNGGQFSNTVEHTLSMLPIGEYKVKLKPVLSKVEGKVTKSRRKMIIIPVAPLFTNHSTLNTNHSTLNTLHSIAAGNSWKDSLAHRSIVIGEPLIPGCVIKSPMYADLLFERMEKSKTPITLTIRDYDCRESYPDKYWLAPSDHGCPPSRQYVEVDTKGNTTIHYGDGTKKYLSIEQQQKNRGVLA